jgi:hypothetical protein
LLPLLSFEAGGMEVWSFGEENVRLMFLRFGGGVWKWSFGEENVRLIFGGGVWKMDSCDWVLNLGR